MAENDQFEAQYARIKSISSSGMRLTESGRAQADNIISQFLREHFDEDSGIPMDRIQRGWSGVKFLDIEDELLRRTVEKHDIPEGVDQKAAALAALVENVPSLQGMTLNDAMAIVSADLAGEAAVPEKFGAVDPNLLRAAAYTTLHVHADDITDPALQGQNFAEMAGSYLHYAAADNQDYTEFEAGQRSRIIDALSTNPEVMADLARIKSPQNIGTAAELQEQFHVREHLADAITNTVASVYGLETLNGEDMNIVYRSRHDFEDDRQRAFLASHYPGVENDETIIVRYNPAYDLMDRIPELSETDAQEQQRFLETVVEELQHTVDHIHADQLLGGRMDANSPLAEHTALHTMNKLFYHSNPNQYDDYAAQYIESTAKVVAEDVAARMMERLQNTDLIPEVQPDPSGAPVVSADLGLSGGTKL